MVCGQGGGKGGVSGFTSNLSRSKSFRYSMANGLGGREGIGIEGDDMATAERNKLTNFL